MNTDTTTNETQTNIPTDGTKPDIHADGTKLDTPPVEQVPSTTATDKQTLSTTLVTPQKIDTAKQPPSNPDEEGFSKSLFRLYPLLYVLSILILLLQLLHSKAKRISCQSSQIWAKI